MLKPKSRTVGRKYHRGKTWIKQRNAAFDRSAGRCEVSSDPLGAQVVTFQGGDSVTTWHWKRAADHIIPERWVRRFIKGANPHILENLIVITPELHAQKTAIERRIHGGNWLAYKQELIAIGFTEAKILDALKALCNSAEKRNAK